MFTQGGSLGLVGVVAAGAAAVCGAQGWCLVTDLLDHHTHPAHLLAEAYRWRWDGSDTALREAKSAIRDAGPATGAILRSMTPDLIRQEHAAWITATELVHAATRSAAALARPFRKGGGTGQAVAARHLSFTTTRRALITTVRAGTATASIPEPAQIAAHDYAWAVIATARVTTDRHRHRDHKIKTRQPFPHAPPRHHHPHHTRPRARLRHHRGLTQLTRPLRPDPRHPSTKTSPPGLGPGAPGQTAGPPPVRRRASTLVYRLLDPYDPF